MASTAFQAGALLSQNPAFTLWGGSPATGFGFLRSQETVVSSGAGTAVAGTRGALDPSFLSLTLHNKGCWPTSLHWPIDQSTLRRQINSYPELGFS
jgi:hypothetical protein